MPSSGFGNVAAIGDGGDTSAGAGAACEVLIGAVVAPSLATAFEWHPATATALTSASSVTKPVSRMPLAEDSRLEFIIISVPACLASHGRMIRCVGDKNHPTDWGP